jgi:hypothetical protein
MDTVMGHECTAIEDGRTTMDDVDGCPVPSDGQCQMMGTQVKSTVDAGALAHSPQSTGDGY